MTYYHRTREVAAHYDGGDVQAEFRGFQRAYTAAVRAEEARRAAREISVGERQ